MFTVTEAEAAAIRTAFDQGGEFAAAVELRRLFPGVTDNAEAGVRAHDRRVETAAGASGPAIAVRQGPGRANPRTRYRSSHSGSRPVSCR